MVAFIEKFAELVEVVINALLLFESNRRAG
jgi:hypothetical protein